MDEQKSRAIELLEAENNRLRRQLELAQMAFRFLKNHRPVFAWECVTDDLITEWEGACDGSDESITNRVNTEFAPFFSEAVLYPVLGKDEARTVLGMLRPLEKALFPFSKDRGWDPEADRENTPAEDAEMDYLAMEKSTEERLREDERRGHYNRTESEIANRAERARKIEWEIRRRKRARDKK